jgi:GTP1/Obg family GTP-binding protein
MTLDGRKAKIVLILLGLSLAVNLFALSFFAGRWSVQGRPVPEQMRLTYPAEIRADVRSALESRRDEMAAAVRLLREARARMLELARMPELDQEALRGAMAEVRAATAAVQELSQSALAEALAEATAEERADIRRPGLNRMPRE